MADFFSLYRALIDNRYLLDTNVLTKSLNYLKQFGRMDTKVTQSWWQAIEKLKLHENTLDKVGKTLSFASFISSIGSITLSAIEAMNQEIAYQHLSLISESLKQMEGQGEYFPPDFKQALTELTQENDDLVNSSFISDFTENFYYEWEKNKDNVSEKGLSLFMGTAGKKIITTTLQKAGLSHVALPALAWSLSIQYSYHVIQSGRKGIDLFHRYVITTDTLFWLRKMRDYAYANQDTSYLSLNLLDATSQLYAYQLLEALLNTTPLKLMFWKLGTRKLALSEITSTQEELKNLFPGIPPKMITWEKTFGGSEDDWAYSLIQTSDGGYAVTGNTKSKDGVGDFWLLRLDEEGNRNWDKTYGGNSLDRAYSLIQTSEGGYAIAGLTFSKGAGESDFWIIKLDREGNMIWDKTFGGSEDDWAFSLIQTTDGGYAVAGYSVYEDKRNVDVSVIKMDHEGNIVWDKTFGGSDDDRAYSLIQTSDGGYAVAGFTDSKGAGKDDFWVIKLDSKGNIVWDKTYGGSNDDYAYSLIQTTDGCYVIAGESRGDAWVIKLDSLGDLLWDKTYDETDVAYSLIQTYDGGYTVAGWTRSKGVGGRDAWIIKLDNQGNLLWEKIYGGSDDDWAWSIIQTNDKGYAVAGWTNSKGAGSDDVWVIKLDEQGNLGESSEEESQLFIPEETSKEDATLNKTYALRDTGPAGGLIFYDKGSYSDGWQYLESAPASTEWISKQWGSNGTMIGGTETGIGTGQRNTTIIVTWLNSHSETDRAAQLCDALVYGGYSDWFLPSTDELNLMYENLEVDSVGGFADGNYWSSSEYDADFAWSQFFYDGCQGISTKSINTRVRAVRAF
ncbi:DUF1566 domain-containing protein [bacterium]|nr:DUF1566 domain-containing protein [bacterium]